MTWQWQEMSTAFLKISLTDKIWKKKRKKMAWTFSPLRCHLSVTTEALRWGQPTTTPGRQSRRQERVLPVSYPGEHPRCAVLSRCLACVLSVYPECCSCWRMSQSGPRNPVAGPSRWPRPPLSLLSLCLANTVPVWTEAAWPLPPLLSTNYLSHWDGLSRRLVSSKCSRAFRRQKESRLNRHRSRRWVWTWTRCW